MPDPIQSNAEVQTTEAQTTTPPTTNPNIDARFAELSGTIREQREQMQSQSQMLQELVAQNAALAIKAQQAQSVESALPPLPDGVDGATVAYLAKVMEASTKGQYSQLESKMNQMLGQVRQSQFNTELAQATAGLTPEIAAAAKKLATSWQGAGLQGWTANDAAIYARGQAQVAAEAAARANRPNGQGDQNIGAGGPNLQSRTSLPPAKTDEELKRMSPSAQEAYWGSRVGDSEIQ